MDSVCTPSVHIVHYLAMGSSVESKKERVPRNDVPPQRHFEYCLRGYRSFIVSKKSVYVSCFFSKVN